MPYEIEEYLDEAKESLNVFRKCYYSWRYPSCWIKNIKIFFRNIKFAWQRIFKGYCDRDLWDVDSHIINLLICEIDEFIKINQGYPCNLTEEEWDKILLEIRDHLINGVRSIDYDPDNKWREARQLCTTRTKQEDGSICYDVKDEFYTSEINKSFLQHMKEIDEYQDKEYEEGMNMLTKWLRHIWY